MTGEADLFPKDCKGRKVTSKAIRDFIHGSQGSLTTFFSMPTEESNTLESDANQPTPQTIVERSQAGQSTFTQKTPEDEYSNGNVNEERKRLNALANCKSVHHEGFWISSCENSVQEFEKRTEDHLRNVCRSRDAEQRLTIIQSLRLSPSKMMSVEEFIDVIGIHSYNAAYTFRKHFKRSFLTGKNALPIYVKDPPQRTMPSMKRELTIVILKEDTEKCAFEKAVKKQKEIAEKYYRRQLQPNFPEIKETFKLFEDEKSKLIGKSLLKSAGFADSQLRSHLNFSKESLERATKKSVRGKVCTSEHVEIRI